MTEGAAFMFWVGFGGGIVLACVASALLVEVFFAIVEKSKR